MNTVTRSGTRAAGKVTGGRRGKTAVAAAETTVARKAATVATTRRCMPTSMLCKQRQRESKRDERREGTEATHGNIINPFPAAAT